jgi:hypothetical protein
LVKTITSLSLPEWADYTPSAQKLNILHKKSPQNSTFCAKPNGQQTNGQRTDKTIKPITGSAIEPPAFTVATVIDHFLAVRIGLGSW